jgi:hypothetical protein
MISKRDEENLWINEILPYFWERSYNNLNKEYCLFTDMMAKCPTADWEKCLENREYGRRDSLCWQRNTLYPQELALASPTSGGRSVGIFRSRTKATEFCFVFWRLNSIYLSHYAIFSPNNELISGRMRYMNTKWTRVHYEYVVFQIWIRITTHVFMSTVAWMPLPRIAFVTCILSILPLYTATNR